MNIYYARQLRTFAAAAKIDLDTPYEDLSEKIRAALMRGSEAEGVKVAFEWEGVLPQLKRRCSG